MGGAVEGGWSPHPIVDIQWCALFRYDDVLKFVKPAPIDEVATKKEMTQRQTKISLTC